MSMYMSYDASFEWEDKYMEVLNGMSAWAARMQTQVEAIRSDVNGDTGNETRRIAEAMGYDVEYAEICERAMREEAELMHQIANEMDGWNAKLTEIVDGQYAAYQAEQEAKKLSA